MQKYPKIRVRKRALWGVEFERRYFDGDDWGAYGESLQWGRRKSVLAIAVIPGLAIEVIWWKGGRDGR